MSWRLTIHSAPRTKKTSNILARAGGRRIVLPSKAWARWVGAARITLQDAPAGAATVRLAITADVNCRALFYRDALRGDAVGYYQGLADLLEKRAILANDRQIVSWDGSRLLLDRANPRIELELTPVPELEGDGGHAKTIGALDQASVNR